MERACTMHVAAGVYLKVPVHKQDAPDPACGGRHEEEERLLEHQPALPVLPGAALEHQATDGYKG